MSAPMTKLAHWGNPHSAFSSSGKRPGADFGFPRLARVARRRATAAYTAVEVLMSMAVLAVGLIGIIAMQKVTVASNQHAKNLSMATHIAQAWVGVLEAEATLWGANNNLLNTTWLNQGMGVNAWFRPQYDGIRFFGPAFDALGNPVRQVDEDPDAKFCVDLRFSPLTSINTGSGLARVEVRVVWLRDEAIVAGAAVAPTHACGVAAVNMDNADDSRLFHFVFMSSAVRQVVSS